jgi:hypothetical protein
MRVAVPSKGNELTVLSLEILASCRGKLLPDPKYDRLLAVALAVWYDHEDVQDMAYESRILACRPKQQASDLQVKKHHEDISFVGSFPDAQLEWCESGF